MKNRLTTPHDASRRLTTPHDASRRHKLTGWFPTEKHDLSGCPGVAKSEAGRLGRWALPVFAALSLQTGRAETPWLADFESPFYQPGSIEGQRGWKVEQGRADVRAGAGFAGSAGLVLIPAEPFTQARLTLEAGPAGGEVTFLDLKARPFAALFAEREELLDIDSARLAVFREPEADHAALFVFHGDGAGGGAWIRTSAVIPVDPETGLARDWVRITVRRDSVRQAWDVWVDGRRAAVSMGLQDKKTAGSATCIMMGDRLRSVGIDDLSISAENPLAPDADRDGMTDAEEKALGFDPEKDDRDADPEGDGVSRLAHAASLEEKESYSPPTGARLAAPVFSRASGVADGAFSLTLSGPEKTRIFYTLDGSDPIPGKSTLYDRELRIARTTVIKACAVDETGGVSALRAGAWVLPETVAAQSRPDWWPATEGGAAFDPSLRAIPVADGALPDAKAVAASLRAAPVVVVITDPTAMFTAPASVHSGGKGNAEVIWMHAKSGTSVSGGGGAEVRLSGQSSLDHAATPKHSLRLTFPETVEAGVVFGADSFPCRQFVVRNPTHDSWTAGGRYADRVPGAKYVSDAWTSHWLEERGRPALRHSWVHVFVNHIYQGVFDAVEQHDAAYSARRGLGNAPADLIEPDVKGAEGSVRAIKGSADGWVAVLRSLRDLTSRAGTATDDEWRAAAAGLDEEGLIDYILWNWWIANHDWPRRNWLASREAGKWRFLSWDAEMALPSDPELIAGTGARLLSDLRGPGAAFTALSRWAEFRAAVLARFEEFTGDGGALSGKEISTSFDRAVNTFLPLAAAESSRWGTLRRPLSPFLPAHLQANWAAVAKKFFPARNAGMTVELKVWLAERAAESRPPREDAAGLPTPDWAAESADQPKALLDSDGDGIPDEWEILHGLDPHDPEDALADPDGDSLRNFEEHLGKSDPLRPTAGTPLNEHSPGVHTKFQIRANRLLQNPLLPLKR